MPNPVQISVVIITFNEERNIGRCLDAVRDLADEIVVLDSFSTDRTAEICTEKGARFIQHAFDGHIQQKNRAITYATYPYVLSLDADEAPDGELIAAILLAKSDWKYDGYSMNRLTNYCGQWIRHCGWYPDVKLRLWDSRKGKWGGANPHDKYEMLDTTARTWHLAGNILHYSYYTVEEHYRQTDKFSTIAAKALAAEGKSSHLFEALIKTLAKFIRNYFIKAGFLDGKIGFVVCRISAYETWMRYRKLASLAKS
jgi:glycosyltransferase involved in cell wall biosynthesis